MDHSYPGASDRRACSQTGRRIMLCLALLLLSVAQAQVFVPIGTTNGANTNQSYPTPFGDYYENHRAQYLYRATELSAAGIAAGATITHMQWNVTSLGTSGVHEGYSLYVGTTTTASLGSGYLAVPALQWGPQDYQPVAGLNTFALASPIVWNGTDNILVQVCHAAPNASSANTYTSNAVVEWRTSIGFNGSYSRRVDNNNSLCGTPAGFLNLNVSGTQTTRPRIYLGTATCEPLASAMIAHDCGNGQFYVNVNVTGLSGGPSVSIGSDYPGNPGGLIGVGTGIHPIGPFPSQNSVNITVSNDGGGSGCETVLGPYTFDCSLLGKNALSFDAVNDRVNLGNSSSLRITGTQLTLEAWIYPTSWRTEVWRGSIINKESTGNQGYMIRCGNNGQLSFNFGSGSGWVELQTTTGVLSLNTWQHVAATYNGTDLLLYINGALAASSASTAGIADAPTNQVVIGNWSQNDDRGFAGRIDEVRIWATARSQTQIADNMDRLLCGNEGGLRAYYDFDHGVANMNNAGVTTLVDRTANGNDGTLSGLALNGTTSNWVQGLTALGACVPVACPEPDQLSITGNLGEQVTFGWMDNGASNYVWEVRTSGLPGSGPMGLVGSGNTVSAPVTVTGLSPVTAYMAYVRGDCTSPPGTSAWSSIPFATGQIPVTVFPWSVDLTSATGGQFTTSGQANTWYIGPAAGNPAPGMYISSDGGATNSYNTGSASVAHFYRDILFPASGVTVLKFDWSVVGETLLGIINYDYVRVWLVPAGFTPVAGTQIAAGGSAPTGNVQLAQLINNSAWTSASVTIPAAYQNTLSRLVFEWRNDGSGGNVPVVIDNLLIINGPACTAPTATASQSVDCNAGTYTVTVNVTGLGSASSVDVVVGGVTIADNVGTGSYTSGPIATGTASAASVLHGASMICDVQLGSFNGTGTLCNDNCTGAINVSCGSTVNGSTAGSTIDGTPSQTSGGSSTVQYGVWYRYFGDDQQVTVSTCGGPLFDTRLHVYRGSCGALIGVAGNDDAGASCGTYTLQSTVSFNAFVGQTYYIAVEGYSGTGSFQLSVSCAPLCAPVVLNDACPDAQPITMSGNCSPVGGNLGCATPTAGANPNCAGSSFASYPDAYYTFTATGPDAYINLSFANPGLQFVLYNGGCGGAQMVCANPVSGTPTLVSGLTTGNTYTLRVFQLLANAGTFSLCVQKLEVSDDPCAPVPIMCGDNRFGRTTGRANNVPPGACPFNGAASTGGVNFFAFTALEDGDVSFSTCGSTNFNTRISVFTGACGSLACTEMNDDAPGCPGSSSTTTVRAATGQAYLIMVHGTGAAEGDYQMSVFCEPWCASTEANDRCEAASPMVVHNPDSPDAVPTTETLSCSYHDGPTGCSGSGAVQGVWYTFSTDDNADGISLYLGGNEQDPVWTAPVLNFALYSGGCSGMGALNEALCVAGANGTTPFPSLAPNSTYHLLVYNTGSLAEGTFGLLLTRPGMNDAGISAVTAPDGIVCDQRMDPVVTLMNFGQVPLTSATIASFIDGNIVQEHAWEGGPLATGESVQVSLPTITTPPGLHSYTASVIQANGAADEESGNSATTVSYDASGQSVNVAINTDTHPEETSWALYDAFFFPVGAGGPYGAGDAEQKITTGICLPTTYGNCYYFYLFDAAGDGIAGGDWALLDGNDRSVLADDGAFGGVSPSETPGYSGYFAHEFCLPLGPSPIMATECNVFNNYLNNKVYTTPVSGVVNYQFEFADPNGGWIRRISIPRNWVKFGELVTYPLTYGITYYARARADQGAAGFADDFFGAGCEMALNPDQPACTGLVNNPGSTYSCGVTRHFGGSDKLWAQPVPYATQYRFRFTGNSFDPDGPGPLAPTSGTATRNITQASYTVLLNWYTYALVPGNTYSVTVEVLIGGQWSGECGGSCPVSISGSSLMPLAGNAALANDRGMENNATVSLWPNPASNGRVNLLLNGLGEGTHRVSVDLYDLSGKRLMAEQFVNDGDMLNTVLDLDESIAAGPYMVHITVDGQRHIERLNVTR